MMDPPMKISFGFIMSPLYGPRLKRAIAEPLVGTSRHPPPLRPPILVSSMVAGTLCRTVSAMTETRPMTETINVNINGTAYSHDVEPRLLLIHYLREVVGLTGPHIGCETSLCGACTVELNGKAVKSCAIFAIQADGAKVTTIEGLAVGGKLHAMQEAFWNEHGAQCGFCTPGMIMASKQIIDRNPHPTDEEIRMGLEGNVCRCTVYQHIVNAVRAAAKAGAQ